jgi:SAM-dependent methyltransferase
MIVDVYNRKPLDIYKEIPVFSKQDNYTENYEQISTDHLTEFRKTGKNPFMVEHAWREFELSTEKLIRKYANKTQTVLDVGVGLGRVLSAFPDLRRYGMDISFGYLTEAHAKGIDVCYSLIEDMPYKENQFDIVVCTDVLEHVIDFNLCVTKILSVLKPGGILIARVPYREDLGSYASPSLPYKFCHLRCFDAWSLQLILERVFNCAVVEKVLAGYLPYSGQFKCELMPGWPRKVIFAALNLIHLLIPRLYQFLVKKLFRPMEINVVARKPKKESS